MKTQQSYRVQWQRDVRIGYVKDLDRSADIIKVLQGLGLPARGNIGKSLESEF